MASNMHVGNIEDIVSRESKETKRGKVLYFTEIVKMLTLAD